MSTISIDPHTAITTIARRIARDANTTTRGCKTYYDAEGVPLYTHEAELRFAQAQPWSADVVLVVQGTRGSATHMTYRQVQDMLDARATYAEESDMTQEAWIGFYLQQVDTERRAEAQQ